MSEPTLTFLPEFTAPVQLSSYCCDAPLHAYDAGTCPACQMLVPSAAPYTSDCCGASVVNLTPGATAAQLECTHCLARWNNVDANFGPVNAPADGWNPDGAPDYAIAGLSYFDDEFIPTIPSDEPSFADVFTMLGGAR